MDKILKLKAASGGSRLDKFLSGNTSYTRTHIQRMIKGGDIKLNSENAVPSRRVNEGDVITVREPAARIYPGADKRDPSNRLSCLPDVVIR